MAHLDFRSGQVALPFGSPEGQVRSGEAPKQGQVQVDLGRSPDLGPKKKFLQKFPWNRPPPLLLALLPSRVLDPIGQVHTTGSPTTTELAGHYQDQVYNTEHSCCYCPVL